LAAPTYLERHGEPQHPEELARHNCLVYTGLVKLNEWEYHDGDGRRHVVRVHGNFESNSSEAMRQATMEGIGISYATLWVYGDDLRAGLVRPILTAFQPPPLPLNVVFQPTRRPSLKVNSFVSFFAEAFNRDPDIAQMLAALAQDDSGH
jgi:DNA-binding transcriptional LysR family regulator